MSSKRRGRPLPDRARAPYNFVPLASSVVFPEGGKRVSHDVPFSDGVCGTLDLQIRAETPIFVRGTGDPTRFFRLPDGVFGIPGTSLRGMLRSVVEIACFGKMSRVNDHRYGIRDLHNRELYGKHMAEIVDGRPTPLVNAGWLRLSKDETYGDAGEDGEPRWVIEPCHFAKIEYAMLEEIAGKKDVRNFNPGRKQSAPRKYQDWQADLEVECSVQVFAKSGLRSKSGIARNGDYGKVVRNGQRVNGRLVFTGQPSEYSTGQKRRKHHDFVFYESAGGAVEVPWQQRKDFSFVHGSAGEQHRLDSDPNPEWKFMLSKLRRGEKVPVFYLLNADGSLRAFGLAMMFRLAYKRSTLEAVKNVQGGCQDESLDMAELLFGRVRQEKGKEVDALRGRVSIEAAVAEGLPEELGKVEGVLGTPKASYYPNYVVQGQAPGDALLLGKDDYETYQDARVRVRGWKRYPQRRNVASFPPLPRGRDGKVNRAVVSSFWPLAVGEVFTTRVHMHNLRPFELGALLWAIDFGGREQCCHGLGLAKAFGYGGVKLSVTGAELIPNRPNSDDGAEQIMEHARVQFRAYMEHALNGNWECSDQIYQLITMTTPVDDDSDLRHMSINHPEFQNEFQGVKKPPRKVLPQAGDSAGLQNHLQQVKTKPAPEPWASCLVPDPDEEEPSAREAACESSAPTAHRKATATKQEEPKTPEAKAIKEAKDARSNDEHLKLFRAWKEEDGEFENIRRQAAKQVLGDPSKKWRIKNRDIWAWICGK